MKDIPSPAPSSGPDLPSAPAAPPGGNASDADAKTPNAHDKQAAPDTQDVIVIETETDPTLNPASPEFDVKKYRKMLSSLDLDSLEHRLKKAVKIANDAASAASAEILQSGIIPQAIGETAFESLQEILEMAKWAKEATQDLLTPELRRLFDMRETLESFNWKTFIESVQAGEKRIKALEPYLKAELPEIRNTPGFESTTLEDIEQYIGLDGQTIAEVIDGQPIPPVIRAAIERAAAAQAAATPETITARRADIVEYPLDKVNSIIWNMLQEVKSGGQVDGQVKLYSLKAEKDGSGQELNIMYAIDFAELENSGVKITKSLMPFDKRVYIAISALFNAGNKVISLTQIFYAMGNTGKPSAYQIQKIQDSITKMTGARVFVDNSQETTVYHYPHFRYDGPLLPIERATAIVNGKIADAAIHIFREPPVMTFAKQRRQITTITVKALQSPISKTDANLLIDDYLLERIARARRGSGNGPGKGVKILYSTLYEAAQIKTYKQKDRAPEKIETYLKHYKACGLISRYTMLKDGVQIDF